MIITTVAGRIGKDAETRSTQDGKAVTSWSVAGDIGYGDRKQTLWFDCSLWGERGRKLGPHIRKGTPVTITGELGQREYEGKTYLTLRVNDVALQGGKQDSQGKGFQDPQHAAGYQAQAPLDEDSIPF